MKKILAILLALTMIWSLAACDDGGNSGTSEPASASDNPSTSESGKPNPEPEEKNVIDLEGQTALYETVTEANKMSNGVQAYYTDNDRTSYVIENKKTKLRHELSGKKFVSGLWNSDGEELLYNTMDSYVTFAGENYYGSDGAGDARINTTKLGYYYYSTYVRDMDFDESIPLYLEKAYHTYADRTYQQFRIIASDESNYVTEFGYEVKLKKSHAGAIEISDGATIYDSLENGVYTFENPRYIAFDIGSAGIVGLVTAGQGTKLTVTVNDKYYVVRQFVSANGVKSGEEITFANRLYTDETHSFDGIKKVAEEEENPLTSENISVTAQDGAAFVGYNRLTGAYEFKLNSHGFNEAYFKQPQKKYFENVRVKGSDDRTIYLSVKTELPLEGAAVTDGNDVLLPVPVQVGKNFGHEKEEPIYNPLDTKYGEAIMPLVIKADTEYELTVVNAYQKWGNYDLKQLSSIEYYVSYYHLSTGVSESNCIAPYYSAYAKGSFGNAWVLPDFRGCSEDLWADTEKQTGDPQYNSVGSLLAPTDNYGLSMGNYQSSDISSSGMTFADLDYSYVSADGKYAYTMRHVEMPQNDESRTYYTIDFTFLEDTDVNNEAFSIIGFDGRKNTYKKAAYLDENGEHKEVVNPVKKGAASIYKLNKNGSYFTFYDLNAATGDENGNFGCIVKDYSITQDGKQSDIGLAFLNDYRTNPTFGDTNFGSLTLDKSASFKKGDTISVNFILLPYGKLNQTNCDNVINVYNDSVKNAIRLTANVGKAGDDTWVPTVVAENNVAEFTLTGGVSEGTANVNYAVKAQGFTKLVVPKVYEKVNGEWVPYVFSTELGYDGYSVLCENGALTYSFVFTQNAAGRTFKIVTE